MPRAEIALEALCGATAEHVAVPETEGVQLGAVRGVEGGEVAAEVVRVEQAGLELGERAEESVGEPAEARAPRQAVQVGLRDRAADDQRAFVRRAWCMAAEPSPARSSRRWRCRVVAAPCCR